MPLDHLDLRLDQYRDARIHLVQEEQFHRHVAHHFHPNQDHLHLKLKSKNHIIVPQGQNELKRDLELGVLVQLDLKVARERLKMDPSIKIHKNQIQHQLCHFNQRVHSLNKHTSLNTYLTIINIHLQRINQLRMQRFFNPVHSN